jgi:RimJ/RimL family protein N-acetyltransferase
MTVRSANGVYLRDVTEDDLPVFFDQQLDGEALRMAAFPARGRDAFMAHWRGIMRDAAVTAKTVVVDENVAGNVVSFEQSGERLVGYWLGRDFWGRGVATRALADFVEHVDVRPLYARVAEHNVASIRVLEKCGFVLIDDPALVSEADGAAEVVLQLEASSVRPTAGRP